jgi:hypothetical protein
MAIFRRKRNNKYTGNWIWRAVDGREVNLKTKDKVQARERAALAEAGEWPRDARKDAGRAAGNLAAADDGDGIGSGGDPAVDATLPDVAPTVDGPGSVAGPDPEAGEPSGASVSGGASAADLNAAAADVSDAAPLPSSGTDVPAGDIATEMGQELQREFFPNGVKGEGDFGAVMASLALSVEHELVATIQARRKPPRAVPELTADNVVFRVMACACRVLGRQWSGAISVNPWYVVAGVLCLYPVQLAMVSKVVELPKPQPEGA